jgi:glycine cleavage system H protein
MPDDRTFMMGKFAAELPGGLRYVTTNHMWCREEAPGRQRFGFTAYAVRLMQDVYFLDWTVSGGDTLKQLQQIGHIETSKAVADLFAPIGGTLVQFNEELLRDPSAINVDKYGAGWLFDIDGDASVTKDVNEYYQYLEQYWDKTQAIIKGKINSEE